MYPTCANLEAAIQRAESVAANLVHPEDQELFKEAIGIIIATVREPIPLLTQEELKARVAGRAKDLDPAEALLVIRAILPELATSAVLSSVMGRDEGPLLTKLTILLGRLYGLGAEDLAKMSAKL